MKVLAAIFTSFSLCIFCLSTFQSFAQVSEQDSLALVAFYNAMDGPNWDDNTGWFNGPINTWTGITLTNDRVTEVLLFNNNLSGEIPTIIGQLSELKILSLYLNSISGELPDVLGNLLNLEELVLSKNEISGTVPASLNNLTSLKKLVLLSNELTSPLPDLGNLQQLEEIVLGQNDFSGPFPAWILELSKLRFISFQNMGLTGELPPDILEVLPVLDGLKLYGNQLEGDVAEWFRGTSVLNELSIGNNNFRGYLNDGVVDPEITRFEINGNQIEGIPDFSAAINQKSWFYIQENKLGFEELQKAINVETWDNGNSVGLGPQNQLLSAESFIVKNGDEISIQSGSSSDLDQYQWYMDGEEIPGANSRELEIGSYSDADAGLYHCVISHPDFDFELERSPVTLQTDGTTSTDEVSIHDLTLYPNPASSHIALSGQLIHSATVYDTYGREQLSSRDSRLDIDALAPGLYFVKIQTEAGTITKEFMKSGY
jgi:hypothetical protein